MYVFKRDVLEAIVRAYAVKNREQRGDAFATQKEFEYILDDPLGMGDWIAKEFCYAYGLDIHRIIRGGQMIGELGPVNFVDHDEFKEKYGEGYGTIVGPIQLGTEPEDAVLKVIASFETKNPVAWTCVEFEEPVEYPERLGFKAIGTFWIATKQ